jgi:hypothetical protein
MQHQHDLLPIVAQILGAAHDQRRGHQLLLLHAFMGVHPVRAGNRRIVIGLSVTRRDRRRLRPGKPVLLPGWQLAVPVNNGGRAGAIDEIDTKALAGRECDPGFSVRPHKAEYPRRFAVDDKGSDVRSQPKSGVFGRGGNPRCRQERDAPCRGKTGRKHFSAAQAHGHSLSLRPRVSGTEYLSAVIAGLDPQVGFTRLAALLMCGPRASPRSDAIRHFSQDFLAKKMDARVKPAHDGSRITIVGITTILFDACPGLARFVRWCWGGYCSSRSRMCSMTRRPAMARNTLIEGVSNPDMIRNWLDAHAR